MSEGNGDFEGTIKRIAEITVREAMAPYHEIGAATAQAVKLTLAEVRDMRREMRRESKHRDVVMARMSVDLADTQLAILRGEQRDATQDAAIAAAEARARELHREYEAAQERAETTGTISIEAQQRQQSDAAIVEDVKQIALSRLRVGVDLEAEAYRQKVRIAAAFALMLITVLGTLLVKGYVK